MNKCSVDKIAVSSRHLMLNILSTTLEKIEKILPNYGLDQEDVTNILENLNNHMQSDLLLSNDIFLNTYSQEQLYSKYCKLVSPEPILMGHNYVRCHGKLTRKRVFGYIVPLQKQMDKYQTFPKFGISLGTL